MLLLQQDTQVEIQEENCHCRFRKELFLWIRKIWKKKLQKNRRCGNCSYRWNNFPKHLKIKKICKKFKVPLVEGIAQAMDQDIKEYLQAILEMLAQLVFTTKVMTTGEGGMIVTNNKKFTMIFTL